MYLIALTWENSRSTVVNWLSEQFVQRTGTGKNFEEINHLKKKPQPNV
jgi:hypothetical protein